MSTVTHLKTSYYANGGTATNSLNIHSDTHVATLLEGVATARSLVGVGEGLDAAQLELKLK